MSVPLKCPSNAGTEGACTTSSAHIMVLSCASWLCVCSGVSSSGINAGAAHADDVCDFVASVVFSGDGDGGGVGVSVGACRRSRSVQY